MVARYYPRNILSKQQAGLAILLSSRPRKENNFIGYGYQFWLFHGEKRRFALWGSFYQAIYIDPELRLVMVHTAVSDVSSGDPKFGRERFALWKGIVNYFGRW